METTCLGIDGKFIIDVDWLLVNNKPNNRKLLKYTKVGFHVGKWEKWLRDMWRLSLVPPRMGKLCGFDENITWLRIYHVTLVHRAFFQLINLIKSGHNYFGYKYQLSFVINAKNIPEYSPIVIEN